MLDSTFFISLFGFFIILTPLIFIHELGHYIVAIKSGVKVESFSIGFGPELIGFQDKRNTRWKFSLLPLGGYVKMKGEMINYENFKSNDKDTFSNATLKNRALIILAGPLANLILGFLLIISVFYINGRYISPPIVNDVIAEQPASVAGLKSGDVVIKIDNNVIKNFNDIKKIVEKNPKNSLIFYIEREKNFLELPVTPKVFFDDKFKKNIGRIGVTALPQQLEKLYLYEAIYFGFKEYFSITLGWFKGFKLIITGEVNKKDIAGPIGIAKVSGSIIEKGLIDVLIFMAIMSINLGLINLLPIPVLDGGHLCLYIYEAIFKKPLSSSFQITLFKFGFIFLMTLMILLTAFDLGF